MEQLKPLTISKKANRMGLAIGMSILSILSGCGEEPSELPETDIVAEDIRASGNVTYISPGDAEFVSHIDAEVEYAKRLKDDMPLVDHIYDHGPHDDMAPQLQTTPQRIRAQVVLGGARSDYLYQDGACDTLRVRNAEEVRYIGALAIGGEDQAVFVSWPLDDDGSNGDYAYMCMFQDMEPGDNGVVLFTQEEAL